MISSCDVTDLFHWVFKWKRESESSLKSPRLLKTRVVWLWFPPIFLTHSRSAVLILLGHSCWSADLSELLRVRWCRFIGPFVCKDSRLRCLNFTVLLNLTDMTSELIPGPRFFFKLSCFCTHMRGPRHSCPLWKKTPRLLRSQLILSKPWGSSDCHVWEFPEKVESTDSSVPPCCFRNVQTKNAEGTPHGDSACFPAALRCVHLPRCRQECWDSEW